MSIATAAVNDGNGASTSDEDYELISVGIEMHCMQSHHEPPTTPNLTTHDHTLASIVTDEPQQHERFAPSTIGASATASPANPSAYSNDLQTALLSPNNTKATFNQPLSSDSQVPCVKISCGRYFLSTLCTTLGCANFIVGFSSAGENCITLPIYSFGIGVMCMLMVLFTCKPNDSTNMSYILRIIVCFIGVLLLSLSFLPLRMEWLIEKSCQDPDHHDIRLLMFLNIVIIFVGGLSVLCYYCWGYHMPEFRLTSFKKQPGKLLLIFLCTIAIVASVVNFILVYQPAATGSPTSHVCGRLSFAMICCTIIFGAIELCLIASVLFGEKKYPTIQEQFQPPLNPPPVTVVSASDVPAAPNTHPPPPPNIMTLVACYYCSRLLISLIHGFMMFVDGICDLSSYGARTLRSLWRHLLVLFVAIALLLLCIVAFVNMLWSTYLNCRQFRISAIVNMIVSFILTTVWGILLITNRQRILNKEINPFEVMGLIRPEAKDEHLSDETRIPAH